MGVLAECEELDIFETDVIKGLVEYKWKTYAYWTHILSAVFHVAYVVVLIYYINHTYLAQAGVLNIRNEEGELVQKPDSFYLERGFFLNEEGKWEQKADSFYLNF